VGVSAAVLIAAGSGTALASIPDSGGVIHGCYKPQGNGSNSPLGVIDTALSNGKCPNGDTELTWNQTGPQGPQGATGATGQTGSQGPAGATGPSTAGPSGLDTTVVTNSAYESGSATVYCPADHPYVLGGGGQGAGAYGAYESFPVEAGTTASGEETTANQWGWEYVAPATNDTVWAICAK
jgi:hypothetical protein